MRSAKRFKGFGLASIVLMLVVSAFGGSPLNPSPANAQGSPVSGVGPWKQIGNYGSSSTSPGQGGTGILGVSCVTYVGYVYCVGGQNPSGTDLSDVFYAQLLSGGTMGPWTETTDYGATSGTSGSGGIGVEWTSCVESAGYIYCVAGSGAGSKVFYAQLSSAGVGPWTETTDYGAASGSSGTGGQALFQLACVTDSGYIYCVGGGPSTVFYAQLSSSGVGPWTETTDYGAASGSTGSGGIPIDSVACVGNAGYIYCVGGTTTSFKIISDVFSASLGSSGVGAWTENTDYGAKSGNTGTGGEPIFGANCVVYSSYVICVGGDTTGPTATAHVFYGKDQTVDVWDQGDDYSSVTYWDNCVEYSGFIYCWGQDEPYGYSGQIVTSSSTTTTTVTTAHPTITTQLSQPNRTIDAGESVYDTATLSGENSPAGGTVAYYAYSGTTCSGTPTDLGNVTVMNSQIPDSNPTGAIDTPGTYCFQAVYSGDANNAGATSQPEILTVLPSTTSTAPSTTTSGIGTSTTTTPVTPPPSTANNNLLYIGIGLGILLLGAGGFLWIRRKGGTTEKPPPPPPPPTEETPPQSTTSEDQKTPCCGPDITDNVLAGMLKLMDDYSSWSKDTQSREFGYLTASTGDISYNNAWDITELAPSDSRRAPWEFGKTPVTYQTAKEGYMKTLAPYAGRCMKPPYPCDPSVIFLNNCHHPQVVNYVEWGVLARLKDWYDENEAHEMRNADTRTGIANDAVSAATAFTPAAGYSDSSYSDFHKVRSDTIPGMKDPTYPDQVAMCNVGWRLADDYITRFKSGKRPYKLSEVNKLALQSILEMNENKARPMAICQAGCGKYMPRTIFRYRFGDKELNWGGEITE